MLIGVKRKKIADLTKISSKQQKMARIMMAAIWKVWYELAVIENFSDEIKKDILLYSVLILNIPFPKKMLQLALFSRYI